jgi:cytochrome c peroxidase
LKVLELKYSINTFLSLLFLSLVIFSACEENTKIDTTKPVPYTVVTPFYFGDTVRRHSQAGNPMTVQGIELGRMLFYEKKLSLDNSISCASCHKQQFSFSDPTPFSAGVHGKIGKRSSMALVNLFWVNEFFWDGRVKSLEKQVLFPIQDALEMNQSIEQTILKLENTDIYPKKFKQVFGNDSITAEKIGKAIAQFERTLVSSNSRYDKMLQRKYNATDQEIRGVNLFYQHPQPDPNYGTQRGGNCGDCHGGPLTTSYSFHNNGLDKNPKDVGRNAVTNLANDIGLFRAPSLRNIALTAPYMHDGRFKTLEEVLDHYNEHIQPSSTLDLLIISGTNQVNGTSLSLTAQEKEDIIAFLKMLTDSTFITNPQFSDPFK